MSTRQLRNINETKFINLNSLKYCLLFCKDQVYSEGKTAKFEFYKRFEMWPQN